MIHDTCDFPKCKRESDLVWLGKSLCKIHWEYVCNNKAKAIKMLGIKQTKEESIVSKTEVAAVVAEKEVVKELEAENTAEAIAEATVAVVEDKGDKVKRERYNDEIDKRILELDSQKKGISEICKDIGRSYASTMYRLRKLRGETKTEVATPVEASVTE